MNWIFYSFVMFISSNILYLLIRKAKDQKINIAVFSISMFLIPSLANFVSAIVSKIPLFYDWRLFAFVIFTAFLWSYMGNYFSQRALLISPNPGYSLILSKSYIILTTLAAAFLFDSDLTLEKIIGILIIIGFSALISISKERKKTGKKWIWLSIGAHLCWAYGSLASKWLLLQGLSPFQYLSYIGLFVVILNMFEVRKEKISLQFNRAQWITILGIGFSAWFFNLFMQFGYQGAPNPGYVSAINTSSIMTVTLLSSVFFKDHLSLQKIIGILGVIVGLVVILV